MHRSPNQSKRRSLSQKLGCSETTRADLRNRRGTYFSSLVSTCHTHTQLCGNYGHSVEDFSRAQTSFSKCSDRVKTCEAGSSHYRAMTKQGKGIALLLVVRETPIYVDLHPQRTGRPAKMFNPSSYLRGHSQRSLSKYSAFFPPDNTFANKLY
ncbi:hypothetical protein COP2_041088 [Malus domestica]